MTDPYVPDFDSFYDIPPGVPPELKSALGLGVINQRNQYRPPEPPVPDPAGRAARQFLATQTDIGAQANSLSDESAIKLAKGYGWKAPTETSSAPDVGKGSILPFSWDEGGVRFDPTAGLPGLAVSGATLPGDVYSGKTKVMDPETGHVSESVIQRSQALTGLMQPGGAFEAKVPGTVIGSGYVGKLASTVDRAVADFPQEIATGGQWLAAMKKAGKQEELDWRKIDLDPNTKYTKAQVQEILADSKVQVGESILSPQENDDPTHSGIAKYSQYQLPGGDNYREILLTIPDELPDTKGWTVERIQQPLGYGRGTFTQVVVKDATGKVVDTQSEQIKQPDSVYIKQAARQNSGVQPYHSPHWDKPNVLVHTRVSDRKIPDPLAMTSLERTELDSLRARYNKWDQTLTEADNQRYIELSSKLQDLNSLHAEEIQSDWHQAGRKGGYSSSNYKPDVKVVPNTDPRGNTFVVSVDGAIQRGYATQAEAEAAIPEFQRIFKQDARVPDAPFKKSWPDLALKRIMQEAVDTGKDAISWTDGAAQADRYDLSKQVQNITWNPSTGTLKAYQQLDTSFGQPVYGPPIIEKSGLKPQDLPDLIGKEASDKLLNYPTKSQPIMGDPENRTFNSLSGDDLKVGGEGMKAFYDVELPRRAQKLWGVKPERAQISDKRPAEDVVDAINFLEQTDYWDARMEDLSNAEIIRAAKDAGWRPRSNGQSVHVVRITPEVIARVKKGQSLFAKGLPLPSNNNKDQTTRPSLPPDIADRYP